MSNIHYEGAQQNTFYEAPIPLLMGNIPFGDFTTSGGEYHYQKYYVLSSGNYYRKYNDTYDTYYYTSTRNAYVLYNKQFNTYVLTFANILYFYPNVRNITSNNNMDQGSLYLNPFVNDTTGYCSFQNLNNARIKKLYYNDSTDKFQYNYGKDFYDYNKCIYINSVKDMTNIAGIYYPIYAGNSVVSSNPQTYSSEQIFYLSSGIPSSNSTVVLSAYTPSASIVYSNNHYIRMQFSYDNYYQNFYPNDTNLLRTNDLSDLDGNDVCGLYCSLSGNFSTSGGLILGSIVLSGDNSSDLIGNTNPTYNQPINNDIFYIGNNNLALTPTNNNCYWLIGASYKENQDREYLVQILTDYMQSIDQNTVYKKWRYFILKGDSHNPLDYNDFWYWDPPENIRQSLFKASTKWNNEYINEYTFTPYGEATGSITLRVAGCTKTGASVAKFKYIQTTTKTYIGNWLTPQSEWV